MCRSKWGYARANNWPTALDVAGLRSVLLSAKHSQRAESLVGGETMESGVKERTRDTEAAYGANQDNPPTRNHFGPMPDSVSAKEATLSLIGRLEDDVTFEDIMYELHVLRKIERGRADATEGRTVPYDDAKERLDQWLT